MNGIIRPRTERMKRALLPSLCIGGLLLFLNEIDCSYDTSVKIFTVAFIAYIAYSIYGGICYAKNSDYYKEMMHIAEIRRNQKKNPHDV